MKKEKKQMQTQKDSSMSSKNSLDESKNCSNEELMKEYEDTKESLLRLQAEFANFRKRTEAERSAFIKLSNAHLLEKILPVMDNFELALESNKENSEFSKGVQMIYEQFKEILLDEGLTPIPTNIPFDPNLHQAILTEEHAEDNKILQEIQKGYKIGDKVLRHSKVKISKKRGGN